MIGKDSSGSIDVAGIASNDVDQHSCAGVAQHLGLGLAACTYCSKIGHKEDDCWKKEREGIKCSF